MEQRIKIIECPRDAMQGWNKIIPTEQKIAYLNALLKVGFDTLDFGSFVSAKAIPQMADTHQIVEKLDASSTKLLAIIANQRGASDALQYQRIDYLGFPFSISPTFQQRNTNSGIEESFIRVQEIQELCVMHSRELVVYISMAFGNPYGDEYHMDHVLHWANKIAKAGIKTISLADTVGVAKPGEVLTVTSQVIKSLPGIEIGVHLHSSPVSHQEKLQAALDAGCVRFDGAMKGIGGCPMADDVLVGNMNTELMVSYFDTLGYTSGLDKTELEKAASMAQLVFN